MKRYLAAVLVLLLTFLVPSYAYSDEPITVLIDDKIIDFDVQPVMIEDRVFVPVRKIFESLGAEVEWDYDTQSVIALRKNTILSLSIGSKVIRKNGHEEAFDSAPIMIDERVLVPIRFVSEALEADVEWDSYNNTVVITTKPVSIKDHLRITTPSESLPFEATQYMTDNDVTTMWHTNWQRDAVELPAVILIDLCGTFSVASFHYLSRQDYPHESGTITGYRISVSIDGENYSEIKRGSWENDRTEKVVEINSTAKFIKLEALKSADGKYASAAEIDVMVKLDF